MPPKVVKPIHIYSIPRHPDLPDVSLRDILLSPARNPLFPELSPDAIFSKQSGTKYIYETDVMPLPPKTHLTAGRFGVYRDGLAFIPNTMRGILADYVHEDMWNVLDVALPLMTFKNALPDGVSDLGELGVNIFREMLASSYDAQVKRGLDQLSGALAQEHAFWHSFVDLVAATVYEGEWTKWWQRLNYNQHFVYFLALTFETKAGIRKSFLTPASPNAGSTYMGARLRSEIAYFTHQVETELLGPAFWENLRANLPINPADGTQKEQLEQIIAVISAEYQKRRLTDQAVAVEVLRRLTPTLAAFEQIPLAEQVGADEIARLRQRASAS